MITAAVDTEGATEDPAWAVCAIEVETGMGVVDFVDVIN